jgi:DNA-binding MarR family transcriptional regulator/GNAT superfamily N-acetyltransferase
MVDDGQRIREKAMTDAAPSVEPLADAVRRFNRFYTRRIGVLREGVHGSAYSLAEARIIYELAHPGAVTAADLRAALDLDPGYLSRLLRGLESRGLLRKAPSPKDARARLLVLTGDGRNALAELEAAARAEMAALIAGLTAGEGARLREALETAESLLGGGTEPGFLLRPPRPGDYGWVAARHGALYAEERGWNSAFEALVAELVAPFARGFDPAREAAWIAERHGANAGCVFVARADAGTAKLRMLLVEPQVRRFGLGRRLIEEAIRFARMAGYRRMTLWTYAELTEARRLYERFGFALADCHPSSGFGRPGVEEVWERAL